MSKLISEALTPAQKTLILDGLAVVKTNIPNVPTLSASDKKAKQQLGSSGLSYVSKAMTFGETYLSVMPRNFDLVELKKDHTLYSDLLVMESKIGEIQNRIQMMRSMAGIDVIKECNRIYKALKDAAKDDLSLKPVVVELGEFYKKRNQKDKTPPPAPGK